MRSPARSWWLAVTAVVSLSSMKAQTAVHSTFINRYPNHYSEPSNWSPAQVPNNTADTLFDVTVNAGSIGLAVDLDATISNLRLLGMDAENSIAILGKTLTVTGATDYRVTGRSRVYISSNANGAGTFRAGLLSTFSAGSLSGNYELQSYSPATLQFTGADVVRLSAAQLTLRGAATQLLDEDGQDALRNLRADRCAFEPAA